MALYRHRISMHVKKVEKLLLWPIKTNNLCNLREKNTLKHTYTCTHANEKAKPNDEMNKQGRVKEKKNRKKICSKSENGCLATNTKDKKQMTTKKRKKLNEYQVKCFLDAHKCMKCRSHVWVICLYLSFLSVWSKQKKKDSHFVHTNADTHTERARQSSHTQALTVWILSQRTFFLSKNSKKKRKKNCRSKQPSATAAAARHKNRRLFNE